MTAKAKEWSPKAKARLAGVFEALEGFTSAYGQVTVLGQLIVIGNQRWKCRPKRSELLGR